MYMLPKTKQKQQHYICFLNNISGLMYLFIYVTMIMTNPIQLYTHQYNWQPC